MKSTKLRSIVAFAILAIGVVLPVFDARADVAWGCTVMYVKPWEYNNGGVHAPMLEINCNGDANKYFANTTGTPSGCATVSPDMYKAFMSIAQSALLSKKPVDIEYYANCSGRAVTAIALSGW